jgi:hypothetical protein
LQLPELSVTVVASTSPLVSWSWTVTSGRPNEPKLPRLRATLPLSDAVNLKTLLCRLVISVLPSMTLVSVVPCCKMANSCGVHVSLR